MNFAIELNGKLTGEVKRFYSNPDVCSKIKVQSGELVKITGYCVGDKCILACESI